MYIPDFHDYRSGILVVFWLFWLCSCAQMPPFPPLPNPLPQVHYSAAQSLQPESLNACQLYFKSMDEAIDKYQVRDAQYQRIAAFPFLRINRFWASFRNSPMDIGVFNHWLDQLQQLDQNARALELQNLAVFFDAPDNIEESLAAMRDCSKLLRQALRLTPEIVNYLRKSSGVPANYNTALRVLGMYPISGWFVKQGIKRYHQETKSNYQKPLDSLPTSGILMRYTAEKNNVDLRHNDVKLMLTTQRQEPFQLPQLSPQQWQQLFTLYAPVFEVDTSGDFDKIGAPKWFKERNPSIDPNTPAIYIYPSFTRFYSKVLIQLNYALWFSERPSRGALDIEAGQVDGIIFRITLDENGIPLLYDAIHQCGCFHLLFPQRDLRINEKTQQQAEPPLIPQTMPPWDKTKQLIIRIESGRHFIQRLYTENESTLNGLTYQILDYDQLRNLPYKNGTRSLFGTDALVAGTQRPERFIFWTMGVKSPGAMRQQGHHAVAFRGQRHFDDPYLLQELFEYGPALQTLTSP